MSPKTRRGLLRRLRQAKPELQDHFKVREIALFGSWARGDQRPGSDIDILVEVDASIGLEFVALAETLERLLDARVELVSRRAVGPRHWKAISDELIYV